MPRKEKKFQLPPNYTFAPGGMLLHRDVYERLMTLCRKARNRNPDAFGMYIYNDFYAEGLLDLIDTTLSSIHTFTAKKKWMKAWHAIVSLSCFMDRYYEWTDFEDGDRVFITDKVYGALMVKTLRELDAAGQLNEETIPDLELCLKRITEWGDVYASTLDSEYPRVIAGYGKKLFGSRTAEERKRMKEERRKAYEGFVKSLSEVERKKGGYVLPFKEEDNDDLDVDENDEDREKKRPWYGNAKEEDASYNHANFKLTRVWREYKKTIAVDDSESPQEWDLTKWPEDLKKECSLDNAMYDDL